MLEKLLYLLCLLHGLAFYGQSSCPVMTFPVDDATEVWTNTAISWNAVEDASGYFLLVGTTPGGRDIIDRVNVGNVTTFTPTENLPANTEIYVKVTVYFDNTFDMTCPTRNFRTGNGETNSLRCTTLISPQNGETGVPTTATMEWTDVPGASGYRLIFYHDASATHIRDAITHTESNSGQINLPANTTQFVRIIPFNEAENALGCALTSFTTVSECAHTINDIDDFYQCDLNGDSFEEFHIDLDVLETSLIGTQSGLTVTYHNPGGDLIDFSIGTQLSVNQRSVLARATDANGCFKETLFNLIVLPYPDMPILNDVSECEAYVLPELPRRNQYFTETAGRGTMLSPGEIITDSQRIYVYAQVGDCSEQRSFQINIDSRFCQDDSVEVVPIDFPKFFTPNNDGVNDFWNTGSDAYPSIGIVRIFDRYGKLIRQFDSTSNIGWDGTFQGAPMPEADYWYRFLDTTSDQMITGHFTLKR